MSFVEVDLFGVCVAPISIMMVAAWLILVPVRWVASRSRVLRRAWHPALVELSTYVIILSALVLLTADWMRYVGR
ncbi:DUF1656 domain-containing protein [Bradyrhizobium sp. Pha-3]|uniref:DUF1656 domain-containing protein n=1 Tax=Bradyrhizobium sp. Pha-3 TaxID=208375 RepID=UPI0035D411EF